MKSVCICSSAKFKPEVRKFARELEKAGVTVYIPYHHIGNEEWENLSKAYKKFVALGLTHDHFYKIRMADVIFIYNKGGYSGNSTTLEIGYAAALGKPIYAVSDKDEELCRKVLVRGFFETAKEFAKILK
ncbi:MAG: nucleoside 2-deoxyribosyltransferase [Patescibacteria group bacterium]